MARTVQCVKLGKEAEGLDFPPYPGELGKALKILADGGDIDYVGGTAVELIGSGESAGNYRQYEIKDGKITTVKYR